MITVDQRAADWIRRTVLFRDNEHYEAMVRLCACQWGPYGHCDAGPHEQCARRRADLRDWNPVNPETGGVTRLISPGDGLPSWSS
ncbi:DUF6248 family natural product biosynthesis protein [Couchioplanes caeruleus]|uniref:Uncharacterized protein n=2 Tax=Couchioplanes caeruleus TaxID=56438 RepID=A0A1K0GTY4_9ACTN|nr:DUF6248 family natural product biosynthesis protein [Couchioplanes caeruleus]OJF12779.1 hypothetical protein BG844_18805 [Couchioplanes caeruleus subsp. caeruleus]ROP29424.1 hypothetical protein EDD30_2218 [Couchioplanes caeruleus]